ncbi:S1 family peptidase [Actinoplanes sp. NPDC026619]|uniref:S1 family peptidase n=1 Tax=Actinoplanes sp. NPDC026619 TaxID=3155798 RepID=UPI0033C36B44
MVQSLRARWRVLLISVLAAFALLWGAGTALGVVGGSDVPQGGLAFVARIAIGSNERNCTGVLVDPRVVLTASSCFADAGALHNGVPVATTTVTLGSSSSTVTMVLTHPQRDLALARLRTPISSVTPVALSATAPAAGDELTLAGFGRSASDWNAGKLRSAKFKVDAPTAAAFDVVATGSDAVGLCKGDAGGPALRLSGSEYQLAGLHHTANQAQCLGEAAGDPRGNETRLDDVRGWVTGNLTGFASGSELGQTTPTWTNTKDDNGGVTNVKGICCDLTGPELFVSPELDMGGGERALVYSGLDNSTTESYGYLKAYDLGGQPVRAGTVLSYWVYPQSNAGSWGLASGNNSTCIGIDLISTDNSALRDAGVVDTRGISAHPAKHCGQLTMDKWNQVVVPIGKWAGKRLARLAIGYDQPANTGGYRGYIDEISISEDAFNTGVETGQTVPKWTSTVSDGGGSRGGSKNVGGITASVTGPELLTGTAAANAHTGAGELVYTGLDNNATQSYAYMKVFAPADTYVTPATKLSYWIFPQSETGSAGLAKGNNSACVAVDLIFKDVVTGSESALRNSLAPDQRGVPAHPAWRCVNATLDTWNYVSVPLGELFKGKQIIQLDIGYDQPGNTGGYRGFIDDIRISR